MRGDNSMRRIVAWAPSGSPPHAWGQYRPTTSLPGRCRFTPTCVGTMVIPGGKCFSPTVHPHMRGDNVGIEEPLQPAHRFTPTCVGTIPPMQPPQNQNAVHPHMRGDNVIVTLA